MVTIFIDFLCFEIACFFCANPKKNGTKRKKGAFQRLFQLNR
jgi:ABC-type multidrug transport system permease subunit